MDNAAPFGIWALAIPACLFLSLVLIEFLRPRRTPVLNRFRRWGTHAIFFGINAMIGRFLIGLFSIAAAANWAAMANFGLFNLIVLPFWLQLVLAFIILDFAVWFQHVLMHHIPILWRIHKVHHSDRDLDTSSALRFHPFELIISILYKSIWVAALGVPVVIALAFELWLNGNALFNHSNINLPRWLDRVLRPILVTPDWHFVHHSSRIDEQNQNFGFALSIWDRIFKCYLPESRNSRDKQLVGLEEAQDEKPANVIWALSLPLRKS